MQYFFRRTVGLGSPKFILKIYLISIGVIENFVKQLGSRMLVFNLDYILPTNNSPEPVLDFRNPINLQSNKILLRHFRLQSLIFPLFIMYKRFCALENIKPPL